MKRCSKFFVTTEAFFQGTDCFFKFRVADAEFGDFADELFDSGRDGLSWGLCNGLLVLEL